MNRTTAAFVSGAAGAVCLNLMHECARKSVPDAPRVDIVGMRAVERISAAAGVAPPEHLRTVTFAGDVAANSLYYSAVGFAGPEHGLAVGAGLGVAAGLGAVLLPRPMGLGDAEVNRTPATTVMTAGMYLAAGLIAGALYRVMGR
jgi:hypothetical protein